MNSPRTIRRTQERYFSAHHMLLVAAERALESAEQNEGSEYDLVVAATMSAFAVEAFLNAVGHILVPEWNDLESASPSGKLRLLGRELRVEVDPGQQPWQGVFGVMALRNKIVHAKPERLLEEDEILESERDARKFEYPKSKLERQLSVASVRRSFESCERVIDLLTERVPEHQRLDILSDGWTTTHDPE